MALPTFTPPLPPSEGTTNKPKINLIKTQFGDGYSQVTRDGINHIRNVLSLTWETLTPAQGRLILDFFEERGGDLPFYYKSIYDKAPKKWTCEEWSPRAITNGFWSITATFEQSFSLQV